MSNLHIGNFKQKALVYNFSQMYSIILDIEFVTQIYDLKTYKSF